VNRDWNQQKEYRSCQKQIVLLISKQMVMAALTKLTIGSVVVEKPPSTP